MTTAVIHVEGLSKQYGLPFVRQIRRLFHKHSQEAWPLKDISFDVNRGESFAVLGRNGAGKSTLLKLLAGVSSPTYGYAQVRGRIFPMLELNAGLHPELTGLENIRLLGSIMGMRSREIAGKLPDIIEFSELEEHLDRPVRTYSSGMLARLGFSVATHVDADVLLIDEVLGVGDYAFQRKCIERTTRLANSGVTVVLVTHNAYLAERLCKRALLLDAGRIAAIGDSQEVMGKYLSSLDSHGKGISGTEALPLNRSGSGELRITRIESLNEHGQFARSLSTGRPGIFRLYYKVRDVPLVEPVYALRFFDQSSTEVLSVCSAAHRSGHVAHSEGFVECRLKDIPLMPGTYTIQVRVGGDLTIDMLESAAKISISADHQQLVDTGGRGIAFTQAAWTYESGHPGAGAAAVIQV